MVHPGVFAERHPGPLPAKLRQQGLLLALPPGILQLGKLRADALHLLAQGRNLGVHTLLVELADAAQLALHQLQASDGYASGFGGHKSSKNN